MLVSRSGLLWPTRLVPSCAACSGGSRGTVEWCNTGLCDCEDDEDDDTEPAEWDGYGGGSMASSGFHIGAGGEVHASPSSWRPLSAKMLLAGARHWFGSCRKAEVEPDRPVGVGSRVRLQGITTPDGQWQNGLLAVVRHFDPTVRHYTVQLCGQPHVATALSPEKLVAVSDGGDEAGSADGEADPFYPEAAMVCGPVPGMDRGGDADGDCGDGGDDGTERVHRVAVHQLEHVRHDPNCFHLGGVDWGRLAVTKRGGYLDAQLCDPHHAELDWVDEDALDHHDARL